MFRPNIPAMKLNISNSMPPATAFKTNFIINLIGTTNKIPIK